MRVLQINAVYGAGSTGRTTAQCHEYMRTHGIESFTACQRGRADYIIGSWFSQKMHSLLARITGREGVFSRRATRGLINYIEKISPDVVCLRNLHSNYVSLPLLLSYLAKKDIPTVAVLHDCWFYTGKCMHYTRQGCYGWQKTCSGCKKPEFTIPYWFFPCSDRQFEMKSRLFSAIPRLAVVGVSDWITGEAKKSHFRSARMFRRIYNFADGEVFRPRGRDAALLSSLGIRDEKVIFSCATRFDETKGIQRYSELMKCLGEGYRLILAGNVTGGSVPDGMIAVGSLSEEELPRYYSSADVFLSLSPEESFGKTIAESLFCGTPVVCSDMTACPEIAGDCGISLDVSDIRGVAAALKRLCGQKEAFTERCRARAEKYFSKDRNIEEYIALFREISESGRT